MSKMSTIKTATIFVLFAFSAAALMSVCATASAQDKAPGAAGYKIAVADMVMLMKDYKKREQKYAELQKKVEALEKELDVMQTGIESSKKAYDEKKSTMTDEERAKKELEINKAITEYKAAHEMKQKEIDSSEESVMKEVVEDIQKAIAKIAEAEGYHLVLNSGGGPRASVLYNSPTIDITSKVLAVLNV